MKTPNSIKTPKPATDKPNKRAKSLFDPLVPNFTKPILGIVIFLFATIQMGSTIEIIMAGIIVAKPNSRILSATIPRPKLKA
jgi:mannitol-specific phosphotransferase system IIBC component